jgi:pyruvate dehydrogenase E1 component alpha subunit
MKTGGVAIAFVGDGGSNQGTTFESYNHAKVWNLPAIFVVEDNGYAESTGSKWSVGGSQVGRGNGFGIPSMEVDGCDFFTVYDAAREAIERARAGSGPTLIHMKVMRYYGHFEGDATTYKAPDEVAKYKAAKDPLMLFRNRVTEAGLLEGKALDEVDRTCKQRIQQCVASAKSAKSPTEADLLTDVYTSAY